MHSLFLHIFIYLTTLIQFSVAFFIFTLLFFIRSFALWSFVSSSPLANRSFILCACFACYLLRSLWLLWSFGLKIPALYLIFGSRTIVLPLPPLKAYYWLIINQLFLHFFSSPPSLRAFNLHSFNFHAFYFRLSF